MTDTATSCRTYVPCGHEECHQYVSAPLGSVLADVRCSGHASHCPHNVLMQLDDSFTNYYGLDKGAYNMICTTCGYLTGPQVLLPPFKLPS